MQSYSKLMVVVCVAAGYTAVEAGDLTGRVVLKGAPKPEVTIDMAADPKCGALHDKPVTTRHYVVGKDGGLANVLVYVKEGVEKKDYPLPSEEAVLDQKGCEYHPYVQGVRVGQTLAVKNSDPTLHNVNYTPKAGSPNKGFNFAQPVQNSVTKKKFESPEVAVRFKCDVHPWMFAYVGVFEHPFFAVTDAEGNFKISGLPDGKYTVEAYHVKTHGANPGVAQEVTVAGAAKADFTVEIK
jgi:plastocyanin